jgi:hypothetical protein
MTSGRAAYVEARSARWSVEVIKFHDTSTTILITNRKSRRIGISSRIGDSY